MPTPTTNIVTVYQSIATDYITVPLGTSLNPSGNFDIYYWYQNPAADPNITGYEIEVDFTGPISIVSAVNQIIPPSIYASSGTPTSISPFNAGAAIFPPGPTLAAPVALLKVTYHPTGVGFVTLTHPSGIGQTGLLDSIGNPQVAFCNDLTINIVPHAEVSLTKVANFTSVMEGQNVTFTITESHVIFGGPNPNVVITDTLPDQFMFISSNPAPTSIVGQTLTWNNTNSIITVKTLPGSAGSTPNNCATATYFSSFQMGPAIGCAPVTITAPNTVTVSNGSTFSIAYVYENPITAIESCSDVLGPPMDGFKLQVNFDGTKIEVMSATFDGLFVTNMANPTPPTTISPFVCTGLTNGPVFGVNAPLVVIVYHALAVGSTTLIHPSGISSTSLIEDPYQCIDPATCNTLTVHII